MSALVWTEEPGGQHLAERGPWTAKITTDADAAGPIFPWRVYGSDGAAVRGTERTIEGAKAAASSAIEMREIMAEHPERVDVVSTSSPVEPYLRPLTEIIASLRNQRGPAAGAEDLADALEAIEARLLRLEGAPTGDVYGFKAFGERVAAEMRKASEPTPDHFRCVCHSNPGKCQVMGHEPPYTR